MHPIAFAVMLLLPMAGVAQLENAQWIFSQSIGLDHRIQPPAIIPDVVTPNAKPMASICDAQGDLLLYTNGHQVFSAGHQSILGSGTLAGQSGSWYAQVLPFPGHDQQFFIINAPGWSYPEYLTSVYYHKVDLSAQGGQGEVVLADQILLDTACGFLTSVPHSGYEAWWILVHDALSPIFHAFLLDSTGLQIPAVTSQVGTPQPALWDHLSSVGHLRTSQQGDKLHMVKRYGGGMPSGVEVFDFDAATGQVSNYIRYDQFAIMGSLIEVSPSGQFAYVAESICTNGVATKLWQYDVSSGDSATIAQSKTLVHEATITHGACAGGHRSLATDIHGRILVGREAFPALGVINAPDLPYPDCDYQHQGIDLSPGFSSGYLPRNPRSFPQGDNTSIGERTANDPALHTWPNPASNQLFVQAQGLLPGRSTLRLFAADGRELRQERPAVWPHTMDVQGLAPGLYLLRLEGPQGSAVTRVVLE